MISLPDSVRVCLIDLDGVLIRTAKVHAAARKEMFDGRVPVPADGASVVLSDLSELLEDP